MDLQDQRIACLRMAIEMGCKPDTIIGTATALINFVLHGPGADVTTAAAVPEAPSADIIAACGTALPVAEAADLVAAVAMESPPAVETATTSTETATEAMPATEADAVDAAVEPVTVDTTENAAVEPPHEAAVPIDAQVLPAEDAAAAAVAAVAAPVELPADAASVAAPGEADASSAIEVEVAAADVPEATPDAPTVEPVVHEETPGEAAAPTAGADSAHVDDPLSSTSGEVAPTAATLDSETLPAAALANGAATPDTTSVAAPH